MVVDSGWSGMDPWEGWRDHAVARARLAAGADPNWLEEPYSRPLHAAAHSGSPEVVTELAGRVADDCVRVVGGIDGGEDDRREGGVGEVVQRPRDDRA